jgi:hypothetical protein
MIVRGLSYEHNRCHRQKTKQGTSSGVRTRCNEKTVVHAKRNTSEYSSPKENSRFSRTRNCIYGHVPATYLHKLEGLHLTLKGEAGAELVAGLVQLLGIKRAANAKGDAAVDLGVVREGCNADVVDLGLCSVSTCITIELR